MSKYDLRPVQPYDYEYVEVGALRERPELGLRHIELHK